MQDSGSAARAFPASERPGGGTTRAARKDVVVFTSDDELLLGLGPAMDDRYRSRPTDGTGAWTETLRGRSGVALIDSASLTNAPEIVRTIEAEFPAFAIIVIARAGAHAQWSSALSRGTIALLLDREALSHDVVAAALETEPRSAPTATPSNNPTASGEGPPGNTRRFVLGGVAVAALVIAGAAWMWLGGRDAAPAPQPEAVARTPAAPTPSALPAPSGLSVPELLSAARVAFGERRYLEPAGNNALEYYSHVLAVEAGNAEAVDGVRRVVAVAVAQAQGEIKTGQFDDASRLVETLRAAAPQDANVVALERDLAAARPRWLVARARDAINGDQFAAAERLIGEIGTLGIDKATVLDLRRSLDARRQDAELARAVADARKSLDANSLLDTSSNGPRAQLAALQKLDRRDPRVTAFQRDYLAALTRSAREATRAGEFDAADRFLAAATEIGSNRDVTDARRDLQAAREAVATRDRQRAEAANQRAEKAAAQAAAPVAAPPRMPKSRKRTAPQYPPDAERNGIEGSVKIEFGLAPNGHTRDIRVVESTPPGVFDEAAIAAVRGWRFEPISAEDAARLPRSSVRLAFRIGERP
ncbi:MAG: TonB family protein [Steroidobacteraceae bacterium]